MGSLTAAAVALASALGGAPAEAEFARTCETRVEGPPGARYEVRPAHDVVVGRVTFIGVRDRLLLGSARRTDPIAKLPAVVTAGPPVTVRLRPLGRARARLDFDPSEWRRRVRRIARGAGQRAVRFEPCAPDAPRFTDGRPLGDQTGFNGGFLVARRGCVRLVARAAGEPVVRRRVALGVPPRRCS
ncbi:MAG TPA: hypothetical protein VHF89_08010 [Solirubrobacteraceae bacterium]|nr:hypothetical protein [Solirubrobacteraceae bacterium]